MYISRMHSPKRRGNQINTLWLKWSQMYFINGLLCLEHADYYLFEQHWLLFSWGQNLLDMQYVWQSFLYTVDCLCVQAVICTYKTCWCSVYVDALFWRHYRAFGGSVVLTLKHIPVNQELTESRIIHKIFSAMDLPKKELYPLVN